MPFDPKERNTAEEIFIDSNGNRFDERGNRVSGPTGEESRDAVCYRTERGQVMRYANVYPGPVNVHQNVPLSNFAIAWEIENPGLADMLAPIAPVTKRSDIYYIIGQQGQEVLRTPTDESDLRAVGATANEVQDVFDTATYTVKNYAYRDFLPDEVADNADEILQMSQHITTFLQTKLQFRRDIRAIAAIVAGSTATASYATACGTGGKFIKDATQTAPYNTLAANYVKAAVITANGMKGPTHQMFGLDVAQALSASAENRPQIVYDIASNFVKNGGFDPDQLSGGLPDRFLGLRPVCAYHPQNTAKKGQTNSFSAYLTNAWYFIHVGTPGRRTLNAVTTFRKDGFMVRSYRDEGRRGMYIECELIETINTTNANGLYALSAPIS